MKATKNKLTATFRTVLLLLLIVFQSCSTYHSQTAEIENDLYNGNFIQAVANIDKNKFLLKDRNRLLYLMEKGKIEHLVGNYEKSNELLEQAYIMIDDGIKTGVGQIVSAQFTNPMAMPYLGEDFEKVTIHYYKALNYFHLRQPNEALVEAKRINIKLYQLNEQYAQNKNKYNEDAFSQILQGLLYESTGDINNAFIAYRNAEEIYTKNGGQFFDVPMPEQLKQDLLRTSRLMGFREEYEAYKKKYPATQDIPAPNVTGEAVVFWENGLGPTKEQIVITVSSAGGVFLATYMDSDGMQEIIIPIPVGSNIGTVNAIAIPKYAERKSYYDKATVEVNGKAQDFQMAQDFYPIARQCLKDRMLREVIDIAIRFATKKASSAGLAALGKEMFGDTGEDLMRLGGDIAGAATEKADTRNWQSLPATISYTRVPLKEGENKFVIKKYGPKGVDTDTLTIPYRRGLQIVNYFDLGRTQVNPAIPNTVAVQTNSTTAPVQNTSVKTSPLVAQSKPVDNKLATGTAIAATYKSAGDATLLNVVENYINACGGYQMIKGVETLYIKSVVVSAKDPASNVETISKTNSRNDRFLQTSVKGKPVFKMVVNEKGGYTVNENGNPVTMDAQTYKRMRAKKSFYDNFMTPLAAGDAKLLGITKMDNEDAYAVSFTDDSKYLITNYYSVNSKLLIASSVKAEGKTSLSHFSDYRDVQGVKFPFKNKMTANGSDTEVNTVLVEINGPITDADFQ